MTEKSVQFRKAIVWTGQWGAGQLGHDRVKKKDINYFIVSKLIPFPSLLWKPWYFSKNPIIFSKIGYFISLKFYSEESPFLKDYMTNMEWKVIKKEDEIIAF